MIEPILTFIKSAQEMNLPIYESLLPVLITTNIIKKLSIKRCMMGGGTEHIKRIQ